MGGVGPGRAVWGGCGRATMLLGREALISAQVGQVESGGGVWWGRVGWGGVGWGSAGRGGVGGVGWSGVGQSEVAPLLGGET